MSGWAQREAEEHEFDDYERKSMHEALDRIWAAVLPLRPDEQGGEISGIVTARLVTFKEALRLIANIKATLPEIGENTVIFDKLNHAVKIAREALK